MQILAEIVSYASAAVGGVFAIFGFINGGLNRRTVFMAIMMALFTVWAASIAVLYGVKEEQVVIQLMVLNYVAICALSYAMMMLTLSFTTVSWKYFFLISVVALIPALCLALSMLIDVRTMFLGVEFSEQGVLFNVLQHPVGYSLFAILVLVYATCSFTFLGIGVKQAKTIAGKRALWLMLVGGASINAFAMIFNLAIPMFLHDYSWGWVGTLALPGFALASYRAVVKFAQDEL